MSGGPRNRAQCDRSEHTRYFLWNTFVNDYQLENRRSGVSPMSQQANLRRQLKTHINQSQSIVVAVHVCNLTKIDLKISLAPVVPQSAHL